MEAMHVGARREARPAHTMHHKFGVHADESGSAGVPDGAPLRLSACVNTWAKDAPVRDNKRIIHFT